jgi:hypothetical protein
MGQTGERVSFWLGGGANSTDAAAFADPRRPGCADFFELHLVGLRRANPHAAIVRLCSIL